MEEERSKTQLVQQKIKHMIQTRKRIVSKGTPTQTKRLKSNLQVEEVVQTNEEMAKPKSSISKRPQSSQRSKNAQVNSMTTDSSNKNDIDVVGLINDAFDRGFDLSKYLTRKNLSVEQSRAKLLDNGLFHTLLASRLGRASEDQYQSIVEKEIVVKLQKMSLMARQEKNCQLIEEKISLLLEQRLKSLSQY